MLYYVYVNIHRGPGIIKSRPQMHHKKGGFELDTADLKSCAARRTGSIPVPGTKSSPKKGGFSPFLPFFCCEGMFRMLKASVGSTASIRNMSASGTSGRRRMISTNAPAAGSSEENIPRSQRKSLTPFTPIPGQRMKRGSVCGKSSFFEKMGRKIYESVYK